METKEPKKITQLIDVQFKSTGVTSLWVNGEQVELDSQLIEVHSNRQWNEIMFKGSATIYELQLDGIDTNYFVHHGFTDYGRGNAGNKYVKYYFKTPIWEWFIDWETNDNNAFRQISKADQGFLPL
jgi:hypothetical protein|tara:strand:- start:1036 stop:1413 length:378 start_codon:yes stop_codon:yes gene_type:complete